jgi:N,N'-diacetylchitobiose transport system substrate-binding protein
MKPRYVTALALVGAVAVVIAASAASVGTAGPTRPAADTLTVWLHPEAEGGWPEAIAAANRAVRTRHRDIEVDVQTVPWGANTHAKFKAALAAGNAPDVIEMGNTETTEYMAAGAFARLTRTSFPNHRTWLKGLEASCRFNGRLYCVPYYAGARAVIYRTDYYRRAGIRQTPRTLNGFVAAGRKLMRRYGRDRNFSAYYHPGKNWYVAMSFVHDYGGRIAVFRGGRWRGVLDSPQAIRALTVLKSVVARLSRASRTTDEDEPYPAVPFGQGKVAAFIGNGWEFPMTFDAQAGGNPRLERFVRAYPMPSHIRGRYMPAFLGGSDLAIPVTSGQKAAARTWIRAFTNTSSQRRIARAGNIANTTTLAGINRNNPRVAPFAEAAKFSWFVPTSPNWPKVENAQVLQNMMVRILTGRASVQSATRTASRAITSILNS